MLGDIISSNRKELNKNIDQKIKENTKSEETNSLLQCILMELQDLNDNIKKLNDKEFITTQQIIQKTSEIDVLNTNKKIKKSTEGAPQFIPAINSDNISIKTKKNITSTTLNINDTLNAFDDLDK